MNKAVLVMDMPETCCDCNFCREIQEGIEACCELMDELNDNTLCRMIDSKNGYCQEKPNWCPLKELPERMKYHDGIFNGQVKGWNNCIDEILNR